MTTPVTAVPGVGPHMARCLLDKNISCAESLANATLSALEEVQGLGPVRARQIKAAATAIAKAAVVSKQPPQKVTPLPAARTKPVVQKATGVAAPNVVSMKEDTMAKNKKADEAKEAARKKAAKKAKKAKEAAKAKAAKKAAKAKAAKKAKKAKAAAKAKAAKKIAKAKAAKKAKKSKKAKKAKAA